jgi:hypothetical protein
MLIVIIIIYSRFGLQDLRQEEQGDRFQRAQGVGKPSQYNLLVLTV